ncbi:bifunctional epoxide hydrolase 2-like [Salvia splendens]|uniref:bifunctional epoxide hydrolase 2-like n=1 Tax=Salvia splendens TaxID=180675 RepID=UPI001C255D32|nr:bifunctional epoxide hydrolase 2-like [Salvia splendens]
MVLVAPPDDRRRQGRFQSHRTRSPDPTKPHSRISLLICLLSLILSTFPSKSHFISLKSMDKIQHKFVQVNGLKIHAAEIGCESSPVVVLLHGFPEIWYSWQHQMIVVAEAGFIAIAPDYRGYDKGNSHIKMLETIKEINEKSREAESSRRLKLKQIA